MYPPLNVTGILGLKRLESHIKILLIYSFSHRTFKDISNHIRSRADNFDMRRP